MNPVKRYWLEAGTILHFEQQPYKYHIPRRGEYFVSEAVFRAADIEPLVKQLHDALVRVKPQAKGVLVVQDIDSAIAEAQRLLKELAS